jgi:group I intron endonuclease
MYVDQEKMRKPKVIAGIYAIRNKNNGKVYVGSSVNIHRRWTSHRKELNTETHTGSKLLRAWKKYGPDVFEWVILEECTPDRRVLMQREQAWIDSLDSYNNGYNSLLRAGGGLSGMRRSPEAIKKMIETRTRNGTWKHSEETKKHLGDIQRGIARGPMSLEQRRLLSRLRLANNWSHAQRKVMGDRARGRVYTTEMRERMAAAHRGRRASPETRTRQSKANLGKPKSKEAIAKMFLKKRASGQFISREVCEKFGIPYISETRLCGCGSSFEHRGARGPRTCDSCLNRYRVARGSLPAELIDSMKLPTTVENQMT